MKYAVFLRGINVGGVKVPMAQLRGYLEEMGLHNVKTYLQTGNVVCDFQLGPAKLKEAVESMLSEKFKYQAFVLVYPFEDLNGIIQNFPFRRESDMHGYVIFCDTQETVDDLMSHEAGIDHNIESVQPGTRVVYWRVPKGKTLDTAFSKLMSKPKYKAVTTNRNINTIDKML